MTAHGVLRGLEFGRERRRQHAPFGAQPREDELFALFGQQSIEGFLAGSLHGVGLRLTGESSITEQNVS